MGEDRGPHVPGPVCACEPLPRLAPLVLRDELVLWEEAELDESYNTRPEGQQTFSIKEMILALWAILFLLQVLGSAVAAEAGGHRR